MEQKILKFLEEQSGYKCYHSHKYSYENYSLPIDEFDDGIKISMKRSGERCKHKTSINLKRLATEIQSKDPLFKFFLDGSKRTYKVDDIAINNRMFPVIAGQIGIGCCIRLSPDKFKSFSIDNNPVLSVPDCLDKDGRNELYFNNLVIKINELGLLKKHNIKIQKILNYSDAKLEMGENYENRGIATIQDEMIQLEKKLVQQIVKENVLNDHSYLIKDGSLEYSEKGARGDNNYILANIKTNYRYVVGVSKSFNPEKCVDEKGKPNAVKLAELPLFHRTPAYIFESDIIKGVRFSIWYLRIRSAARTISQFDGLIKVEKILITDDEHELGLESEEVDAISANLINERNPVAYGSDLRWANHLYPVFLTESFIKSTYKSDSYFLNFF